MDDYEAAQKARAKGTCLWANSHHPFPEWLADDTASGLLWIYGGPGTGKTVLTASLIEFIIKRKSEDIPVLYFFCNAKGNDEHKKSSVALTRSLLFQFGNSQIKLQYTIRFGSHYRESLTSKDISTHKVTKGSFGIFYTLGHCKLFTSSLTPSTSVIIPSTGLPN